MPLQEVLTPALVSAVMTGILAPLSFYILKRRDEREKRNFEVRYAEFKRYLAVLEEIAASTRLDVNQTFGETFSQIQQQMLSDDPTNVGKYLLRAFAELDKYIGRARDAMTRSQNELRGLRLVCSDRLLGLLHDFITAQEELMKDIVSSLDRVKTGDLSSVEAIITAEMRAKANRNSQLFDTILMQMRRELKIGS